MESLLRWGIENSSPPAGSSSRASGGDAAPPPAPRTDLDPGVVDAILGKPDAELMREALAAALDASRGERARVAALDEFEMLVESIDNANNVEKLGMWEPLHGLLASEEASEAIKAQALWAIGTILQNNPAAQQAYLSKGPMPRLVALLAPGAHAAPTRSKAVYALSGLLKHSARAVAAFGEAGGWEALREALEDSDIGVRRKVAFLLTALLTPDDAPAAAPPATVHANSHAGLAADPGGMATSGAARAALDAHGIVGAAVRALAAPVPHGADGEREGDVDFEEKILRLLWTYAVPCKGHGEGHWSLSGEELAWLKAE